MVAIPLGCIQVLSPPTGPPARADSLGLVLFAQGGSARFRTVKAWDIMPSNPY